MGTSTGSSRVDTKLARRAAVGTPLIPNPIRTAAEAHAPVVEDVSLSESDKAAIKTEVAVAFKAYTTGAFSVESSAGECATPVECDDSCAQPGGAMKTGGDRIPIETGGVWG